jgi:hypothetical protein
VYPERVRRFAVLAIFVAVLGTSSIAGAGESDAEVEARAAMKRGLAAFAKRDAETALAEYRKAEALVPDANLPHRYAAEALVELERYEEAIKEYEQYLAIKPDVSDAGEVRGRIEAARDKIDGTINLTSSPAGADVFVDGASQRAGVTPLAALKLRRGQHSIVVRLPGRRDIVLSPTVKGGTTMALAADFGGLGAARVEDGPTEKPPPKKSSPRTVGWIVLGGGVTILAASFAVDAFVLSPLYDDFDRKRKEGDPTALDTKNDVTTLQTTLAIGYGVGAVATIAGAAIVLWPRSSPSSARMRIVPAIGGLSITGTFAAAP